jgi:hypothetical protein
LNGELYRRAFITAKLAIDLISFSSGTGLLLDFDNLIQPGGKTIPITFGYQPAQQLCKAYRYTDISKALSIILTDFDAATALGDLTETIISPNKVVINCARAIETIRNIIDSNADRDTAWATMRTVLNCSKEYLQSVVTPSQTHRHGNYVSTANEEGNKILQRAWTIMNRFFEYRMRGNQSLAAPEFPLLTG